LASSKWDVVVLFIVLGSCSSGSLGSRFVLWTESPQLAGLVHKHVVLPIAFAATHWMEIHEARATKTLDATVLFLAERAVFALHFLNRIGDMLDVPHAFDI
jgi:hypothetical protein